MSRPAKTLERVLRGTSDANIAFDDLCGLLRHLGFAERVKGSHHIFSREGITEILNLQPKKGGKAKPYQVAQVRDVVVEYGLAEESDDEPSTPDRTGPADEKATPDQQEPIDEKSTTEEQTPPEEKEEGNDAQ